MNLKNSPPWMRLFIEGGAIVVSILLAFAIDAWWNDQLERNEEQLVLNSLKAELQGNLQLIEQEIGYRSAVMASVTALFDAAAGKRQLQPAQLDEMLGDITWWSNVDYQRGVVDGLVLGGRLTIIENPELRAAIASLPNRYDTLRDSERNDQVTTNSVVIPYLNSNASLTQIANTMSRGRPGTGDSPTPSVYPSQEAFDHSGLLKNREFLGILVQEHWNHLGTRLEYQEFMEFIESVITRIEAETN